MSALRTIAASLVLALAALAGLAASGSASAATPCRALAASALPLGQLESSYRRLTRLPSGTPLSASGPRRYGICGTTHYAFESLTVARGVHLSYQEQVAQQDHSPVWREPAGGRWLDEGINAICNLAPHALLNAWTVGVHCP